MRFDAYYSLGKTFLALRPTLGQMWNVGKYSWRYFTDTFSERVSHTPLSVGFVITYKCNRSCEGCYIKSIVKDDPELLKLDMDVDRFVEMLNHKSIKNCFRVPLIGGEPLLHKNFFDFVEIASRHKKLVYTFTNGLLIERHKEQLAKAQLDTLRVSLYDDVLEEQKRNVKKLLSAKPDYNVYLSTWATPNKMKEVERAVETALELGVSGLNIQNYMPHSGGKDLNELNLLIWEDDAKTLDRLQALKKRGGWKIEPDATRAIPRKGHPAQCICLSTMLYVDKRGLIVPCPGIWPPKRNMAIFWEKKGGILLS